MAQLLTVRAVAAQFAVSRSSVYKMLEGGVFPSAPFDCPTAVAAGRRTSSTTGSKRTGSTASPPVAAVPWRLDGRNDGDGLDRPGGSDEQASWPPVHKLLNRGVFHKRRFDCAKRGCIATATRSPVLQVRRGADARRGNPLDCEGVTHGRSERCPARS